MQKEEARKRVPLALSVSIHTHSLLPLPFARVVKGHSLEQELHLSVMKISVVGAQKLLCTIYAKEIRF